MTHSLERVWVPHTSLLPTGPDSSHSFFSFACPSSQASVFATSVWCFYQNGLDQLGRNALDTVTA